MVSFGAAASPIDDPPVFLAAATARVIDRRQLAGHLRHGDDQDNRQLTLTACFGGYKYGAMAETLANLHSAHGVSSERWTWA
jgi:hypothetical protein